MSVEISQCSVLELIVQYDSEEFELIGSSTEPKLQIVGNATEEELKETLQEVLQDIEDKMLDISPDTKSTNISNVVDTSHQPVNECQNNEKITMVTTELPRCERSDSLDQSMIMYTTTPSPLDEDLMSISISIADGDYTVFDRITYLGSAVISDPRNEMDVRKNMAVLNEQSAKALNISLSLPVNSEGYIILYEPSSSNEIASFPISQIIAHISGEPGSKDVNCLSLVHKCSQGTIPDSTIFQCHVFRCEIPEAVPKIMQCFSAAVKKIPRLPLPKSDSYGMEKSNPEYINKNIVTYVFEGTLEFKEDDTKGGYASCPKDKDYFKLRCKLEKSVVLTVQQISDNKELIIDRCFGLLISPGRNIRNSDMQLIEMMSFTKPAVGEKSPYVITGLWDPNEPAFDILNAETPKDTRVYMTVAADLVICGIQEPVRFVIETKAKIFPPTERFWYFSKRTLYEQFYLSVREIDLDMTGDYTLQVVGVTSSTKLQNKKASMNLDFSKTASKATNVPTPSSPDDPDSISDNDEPLLSGTGEVSKDCTETQLEGWSAVLLKWRQNLSQRPKHLTSLVRRGIPEALRGEVWQLLAGCHDQKGTVEVYKSLVNKDSSFESIIQRDIYRTFPAHELFNERNGTGQESLYKICKAYSLYDPEIGYCQGLSFLVAALLLHMPEEEAFGVLLKIMFDYHTRDMFRNAFEELHLKFYQLRKLMEDHMPGLVSHFDDLGIEVHMFASQWFLTLFTAKFPLITVFYIIDLFLLDGMDVIFQVALALLMLSQKELLALDFEGVLKHFRVSLPKKYRTEDSAKLLIHSAIKIKVKKLKKYEKEYAIFKEQEKLQEDPIKTLQKENKKLLETNLHLDRENDDLAHELINIKLHLRNELVKSEEKVESQAKELQAALITISELEEEKKRLSLEVAQLKEMCRRELQRAETENLKNETIISQYKQICKQLNCRLEKEQLTSKQILDLIKARTESCEYCSKYMDTLIPNVANSKSHLESLQNTQTDANEAESQARELELELARTKLALVESECKNQDLTHQLNAAVNELQTSKNTWFQKTFSSIRDATKKDSPGSKDAS
ncbi:rab GTPase-activating protein 1 [Trichonephila inaurata madagascariensis]|uniref:Rab GTPase-activating protein 1 n=1 Tax=Trichonephila inaurata madagascariensis TaxID=2747483 RepID=A0A8X7C2T7_9ARAC|nr:rab GTPase-activating protein 1 [Trichonephila inaurata madagascariensis]